MSFLKSIFDKEHLDAGVNLKDLLIPSTNILKTESLTNWYWFVPELSKNENAMSRFSPHNSKIAI